MFGPLTNFLFYEAVFRYVLNLAFLWLHPIALVIFSILFDYTDYPFFLLTGKSRDYYNYCDKSADLFFYIVAAWYFIYNSKRLWYAKIIAVAFIFRAFGNIFFLITLNHAFFLIFPNVGEFFMLFFTALDYGLPWPYPGKRYDTWFKERTVATVVAIAILSGLKIMQEWILWDKVNPLSDPLCQSVLSCWSVLALPLVAALLGTIFATYGRKPNFEETKNYMSAF